MNNWVIRDSKAEEELSSDPIIKTPPEIHDSGNNQEEASDTEGYGSDIKDDASNHTEDCGEDTVEPCGLDPEYDEWISSSLKKARVALKAKMDSKEALASQRLVQIEERWETLDLKIQAATKRYEEDHAKFPNHDVPYLVLGELTEFNHRRKQLSLANSKSPSIQASILAAQASLRRLPSNHMNFSTGIGRARTIREQANHLMNMGLILHSQSGSGSSHPSLLDHVPLYCALRGWSFSKTLGEVSKP